MQNLKAAEEICLLWEMQEDLWQGCQRCSQYGPQRYYRRSTGNGKQGQQQNFFFFLLIIKSLNNLRVKQLR